jgi:methionine biosynthesis protein MetW
MSDSLQEFYEMRKTDILHADHRLSKVVAAVAALSPSPQSILDIGCGRGTLLERLRQKTPDAALFGVDISTNTVEATRARGFDARVADVSTGLPFPSAHFECVIFGEVIEHLVDPDAALREISRTLIDNGTLIVTTPNLASWFNRVLLLLGVQPVFTETSLHVNLGRMTRALGQGGPTQGHLKIFTLGALREMLQANGFAVGMISGAAFTSSNALRPIDLLMANFPRFASNFVVTARKTRRAGTRYRVSSDSEPVDVDIPG